MLRQVGCYVKLWYVMVCQGMLRYTPTFINEYRALAQVALCRVKKRRHAIFCFVCEFSTNNSMAAVQATANPKKHKVCSSSLKIKKVATRPRLASRKETLLYCIAVFI